MKIEKVEKLVAHLHDKTEYVIQIRNLKQALNHRLILKKAHRVIKFNQHALLKPYIDRNTDLKKKAKNDFEKDFFNLMNNAVFRKIMENVRKRRNIKLVTTERRRNFWRQNQIIIQQIFTKYLLAIEMRKKKRYIRTNLPI